MSEVKWTAEQRAAIEARGHTLLVSAAAGSGKTAVLVQRILERVLDEKNPCDVSDFLVVTFTRAAASEMREKMTKAIYEEMGRRPKNRRLERQLALMPSAAFETIDGFYYSLVREFAGKLGISPAARIAPEAELTLLYESVRDELLEEYYEKADSDFLQAVDYFSGSRDDRRFLEVVDQLRRLTSANPQREDFLKRQVKLYESPPPFGQTPYGRALLETAALRIEYAQKLLKEAMEDAAEEPVLKQKYLPALADYGQTLELLQKAVQGGDFDGAAGLLAAFAPPRFAPAAKADEAVKKQVSARRDLVKKQLVKLKEKCFFLTSEDACRDAVALSGALRGLCGFTLELERRFGAAKNERRILDFSDLSHLLYGLLVESVQDGRVTPTDTAREISKRYREILIDEYQDTNELQDFIFRAIAQQESNLFFVGDAKQSIYLFRQAEPRIFVEKRRTFAPLSSEGAACRQLTLSKNFRSRRTVVEFVNAVFSQVMSERLGGLSYEGEALSFGAPYDTAQDVPVELRLLTGEAQQEKPQEEQESFDEAENVARLVQELLSCALVTEKDGTRRRARKQDIVILLRSVKDEAPLLEKALTQHGVAVYSDTPEAFFSRPEVLLLMSLLECIDNPLQDVALAAVLRSPLYGLSSDELAQIRLGLEGQPFYDAVRAAADSLPAAALFLEQLGRWRELAKREPVEKLLYTVLEETGLMAVVASMPMGELRCENVRQLLSYAAEYESTGYRGLFRFNRYLEGLKRSGRDLPAARLSADSDMVRIMSIHKSKGLEFPIVIVCGLANARNKTDLRQRFVLNGEVGVGLKLRDMQRLVEFDTLQRAGVVCRNEREALAEELRCLYVAMTRAKERLLLVVDTRKRGLSRLDPVLLDEGHIHPVQLLDASSLGEVLLLAMQATDAGRAVREHYGLPECKVCRHMPCQVYVERGDGFTPAQQESTPCAAPQAAQTPPIFEGWAPRPESGAERLPSKLTVTRLKDMLRPGQDLDTPAGERVSAYRLQKTGFRRPSFVAQQQEATPAEAGTAMHELVQFAYLRGLADDPCTEIDYLVERGFLSQRQKGLISIDMVKTFTQSGLFARMLDAKWLRRELKFTVLARAGDLLPGLTGGQQEEKLLLQGVIDCIYEGDEGIVLVDYKTDRVRQAQVLVQRYQSQLQLYAHAYFQMTGRRVAKAVIYSLSLGCEAEVPLHRQ